VNSPLRIVLRFFVLLFIQIVILNQVDLHGYLSPMIYPLFILLLPFRTPAYIVLGTAFAMGMIIDGFIGTLGFHTASLVLMAFLRPLILMIVQPRGGYEESMQPSMAVMGPKWFLFYTLLAIIIHHTCYFLIEAMSFSYLFDTILTIVISSLLSLILIFIYQFFILHSKQ
jgi:rod shape-determining protein MreD